jgi:hypothetical protein
MVFTNQNILKVWQCEEYQPTCLVRWYGVHFKLQVPSTNHYYDDHHISWGKVFCPLDVRTTQVDFALSLRWVEATNISIDHIWGTQ